MSKKSFKMQKVQDGWIPFDYTDFDKSNIYQHNEVVEFTPKKVKHSYRSLKQLRKYWVICTIISQQMCDDPFWNTRKKVDRQAKTTLQFYDFDQTIEVIMKDGSTKISLEPISIAMENLDHIEACFYFDQAFQFFADVMNCTVDELMKMEVQK